MRPARSYTLSRRSFGRSYELCDAAAWSYAVEAHQTRHPALESWHGLTLGNHGASGLVLALAAGRLFKCPVPVRLAGALASRSFTPRSLLLASTRLTPPLPP